MTTEAGGAPEGAQNFRAERSRIPLFPVDFRPAENSQSGVTYEPYTQLEEVGFSYDKVHEARENKALSGQVFWVVGVNPTGIGGAIFSEIVAQRGTVVGSSRKPGISPELIDGAIREAANLLWLPMDITKKEDRKRAIEKILETYGRIDGLILAAAAINDKPFTQYTEEEIEDLYKINLISQDLLLLPVLQRFEKQKQGRVVAVSSLAAPGSPHQGSYSTSKAGLDSRMRSLSSEYAIMVNRGQGELYFNSLEVGFVPGTEMTKDIKDRQQQRIIEMSAGTRGLLPQEVAEAAVYLLNPETKISGKVIPIVGRGETPVLDERGLIPR